MPSPEVWLQERTRLERRARVVDWIFACIQALDRATEPDDVDRALATWSPLIVGGYRAVVYRLRDRSSPDAGFEGRGDMASDEAPSLPAATVMSCTAPTVITRESVRQAVTGSVWLALLDQFAASQLICAPLHDDALLVLAERRRDRVVTSEDWDLLTSLGRLAGLAAVRAEAE